MAMLQKRRTNRYGGFINSAAYAKAVYDHELLSEGEEKELARLRDEAIEEARREGRESPDTTARDRLVTCNLRFTLVMCRLFSRRIGDGEFEDLISVANVGLVEAADTFDPGVGARFCTHAAWMIRKRLSEYMSQGRATIRIPRHGYMALQRSRRGDTLTPKQQAWLDKYGADAGRLTQQESQVVAACEALDDCALEDTHAEEGRLNGPFTDDHVEWVNGAISSLGQSEQKILRMRFGIGEDGPVQPATLMVIGSEFGVTRERVRQMETTAIRSLHNLARRPDVRRILGAPADEPLSAQRAMRA